MFGLMINAALLFIHSLLQQLSSIPETANSEDMQEFLALNSDVSTYFGRKPAVKSRIDKVKGKTFLRLKIHF